MRSPGDTVLCPYCGLRLAHTRSSGDFHFYLCNRDGELVRPPIGPLRRAAARDRVRDWTDARREAWVARVAELITAGRTTRLAEQIAFDELSTESSRVAGTRR